MSVIDKIFNRMGMKAEQVSLNLPFGLGGAKFIPNKVEQRAAWSLYVELSTRITTQPFDEKTGLMRAVISSLYSLFGLTRQVLRDAGPEVAHGPDSFGPLAIKILTQGIAPFTTKWNEPLQKYELSRPSNISALEHEHNWERFNEIHEDLIKVQKEMRNYAEMLGKIARIN